VCDAINEAAEFMVDVAWVATRPVCDPVSFLSGVHFGIRILTLQGLLNATVSGSE
jgi:hypothetical protein